MSDSNNSFPCKAVWVSPSKKGSKNNKILLDPMGFKLHYKKTDYKKKFYHCSRKEDMKCPVKVSLEIATDMITGVRGEHNHDNELVEEGVKKIVREKIANAAQNPTVSPRTIMQDITTAVVNSKSAAAGLPFVPSSKAISMSIQRNRVKVTKYPAIPHSWEEMKIPEEMTVTVDKKPFCIMEEKLPGSEKEI